MAADAGLADPIPRRGHRARTELLLKLSRMFGDKVAVVLGSDFPDPDVLPAVVHVLLVKPHGLTIDPTCPMNEDGWIETYDERHFAGKVLEFVWLVAINL